VVAPFAHLHMKVLRRPIEFALGALAGVQDHAGGLLAAHCRGHRQRRVGQFGVVMF